MASTRPKKGTTNPLDDDPADPPANKPTAPTPSPPPTPVTVKYLLNLRDDFTSPSLLPHTIYYLTVTTPSTDSWHYHGPVATFAALIPYIEHAIHQSASKAALTKWKALLHRDRTRASTWQQNEWGHFVLPERGPSITETGITRLVIPAQGFQKEEGVETVLEVVREVNEEVVEVLPAPVYTVSHHGLIPTDLQSIPGKQYRLSLAAKSGLSTHTPAPMATTSSLLRPLASFVSTASAKAAARAAMQSLMRDHASVMTSEDWGGRSWIEKSRVKKKKATAGMGNSALGEKKGVKRKWREEPPPSSALLMAFCVLGRWEVRVRYEDPLAGAVERLDGLGAGEGVLGGKRGRWRVAGGFEV
ncbi:hypothetical protein CC80DRAFT_555132 [Byssothecium circinans]|uniref:Uncharacterized protein n=1 Tax=Byssothecium circinans TaxID=147558 RepID=A0A6A5TAP2_9PLEO|nr:hypothetical protein CC80DRAFT_555132 [Byssothecium circinans]